MLEEVVVSWWEIRWIWQMRQNFVAQFVQPLKHWLYGHCRREELGPFCWPMPAAGIAVFVASWFAEHVSQMYCFHQDSESCSGSDGPQTTKQWPWPFFGCKFGFEKWFGASTPSNHWAGCYWLSYKIHFLSNITIRLGNGSLFLGRIREDDTSRWQLDASSQGTHLLSFSPFQFASNAKRPQNGRCWLFTTSRVVVRGSASMKALNSLLSNSDDQPLCSSSARFLSPLQNF